MTSAKLHGHCWLFGDNVDTDQIIAAVYLVSTDEQELGRHCLEGIKPGFPQQVKPGDIVVAGENFGCGSSREHAPLALKGAGISCVIAKSFARIFFRNAINIGLPIVECPEAASALRDGDELAVDLGAGEIVRRADAKRFPLAPFPDFLQRIIAAGGLMQLVQEKLRRAR